MMRVCVLAAVTWITGLAVAFPAYGHQMSCGARHGLVTYITETLHQKHLYSGLTGIRIQDGPTMVEFWAGDDGMWTVITTAANGVSCLFAAGVRWTPMPQGEPL